MTSAWLAAGAVVLPALSAAAGFELAQRNADRDDIEAAIARDLPDVQDYSFVALPTTEPPGDAYIRALDFVDSLTSGQMVMFQYQEFTLYACAEVVGHTPKSTCEANDKRPLRTVERNGVVTLYSVATKSLNDPAQTAPGMFETVRAYIAEAKFTTTPAWVEPYAEAQLRTTMY